MKMLGMIIAVMPSEHPVWRQLPLHLLEHHVDVLLITGHELAHHLVGGIAEAQCLASVVLLDVEDAEVFRVRGDAAEALDDVDVLRADRGANDDERFLAAVQDHLDAVAGLEMVRPRERFADDDLLVPAVRKARSADQVHPVDDAVEPAGRNADEPPGHRRGRLSHVEDHVEDDARLDSGDAGHIGDMGHGGQRHLLQVDPHVGEAVLAIVVALAVLQDPLD
jgi:hypothetical protein